MCVQHVRATCVLRVMCELKALQVPCFLVNRLLSGGVCCDLSESRYGSMRAFIYDCAKFSFALLLFACVRVYICTLLFHPFFRSLLSLSHIDACCLRFLFQCFSLIIIRLCNGELKCVLGTFCTFLLPTRYFCIKRIHYCTSIFLTIEVLGDIVFSD